MYKFTKRSKPSPKKHYVFVIPDVHVGYVTDIPTYSHGVWDVGMQALKKAAKRVTHVVIIGDFGNWESLSHWASLRADQTFIEEDVALVNARLDEIESITKPNGIKVIFLEGNHEAWAFQMECKYPFMRNVVNLRKRLKFDTRGWIWLPENHFYRIGHLYFTHGHIRGIKRPADMVKRKGVSVAYGHTHHYKTESVRTLTGEHAAWTLGCWASIDPPPPYARGEEPDGWVHGFTFVQIRADGKFSLDFRRVIDETWVELPDGTELIADPKAIAKRIKQEVTIRENLRKEYTERFYDPGGKVMTEPLQGTEYRSRTKRARILRDLPGNVKKR